MGLLKTRPEIALFAPRTIIAGEPFVARVVLRCAEAVPVDELVVELVGAGIWYTSSQYGRHRNALVVARLVGRPLTERVELAAGEHEYRLSFEVPTDAPPSCSGGFLSIEWEYRVRADIPWWPDAKATFVAHVAPAPSSEMPTAPAVYASDTAGPHGIKPYAELSLGEVVSGQFLEGTVALSNTAHNDYRAIEFNLISMESIPSLLGSWTEKRKRQSWKMPLSSPTENALIRFRFQLPPIVPAFETETLALKWMLEVRLNLGWAFDAELWIPLNVRTRGSGDRTEASAPLAVGSDRLAQIWRHAGHQTGFNYRDAELSRESGAARLVIRREHRGRRGLRLVGEARYPDLDLGLRMVDGRLRVRDPGQAAILAETTDAMLEGLNLEHADDERLVVSVDDPGTRARPVADLAERFSALWHAFEDARETLPAPADMADAVPAFQAAARRLGGDLDVASMDIRGSRHETPFALEVQWDDDGHAHTMLEVRPALPIDGRWHQSWHGSGEPGPLPEGLASLLEGARGLQVDAERIRLVFPPCGRDVQPMVDRLEAMLHLARRLSGQGAGYR